MQVQCLPATVRFAKLRPSPTLHLLQRACRQRQHIPLASWRLSLASCGYRPSWPAQNSRRGIKVRCGRLCLCSNTRQSSLSYPSFRSTTPEHPRATAGFRRRAVQRRHPSAVTAFALAGSPASRAEGRKPGRATRGSGPEQVLSTTLAPDDQSLEPKLGTTHTAVQQQFSSQSPAKFIRPKLQKSLLSI